MTYMVRTPETNKVNVLIKLWTCNKDYIGTLAHCVHASVYVCMHVCVISVHALC